jgi:hypothetical protein
LSIAVRSVAGLLARGPLKKKKTRRRVVRRVVPPWFASEDAILLAC